MDFDKIQIKTLLEVFKIGLCQGSVFLLIGLSIFPIAQGWKLYVIILVGLMLNIITSYISLYIKNMDFHLSLKEKYGSEYMRDLEKEILRQGLFKLLWNRWFIDYALNAKYKSQKSKDSVSENSGVNRL